MFPECSLNGQVAFYYRLHLEGRRLMALPGVFLLDLPHTQTVDRQHFASAFKPQLAAGLSLFPECVLSVPMLPEYSLNVPMFANVP
jgi:hypothetical protein